MKKPQIFGKAILSLGVIALSLGTVSCKDENKAEDPKEVAEEANEAKFDESDKLEDNAEIAVDAAEFDLMQRELAKVAQVKAMLQAVKDLAKTVENEHNESFNELSTLAQSKQISIPTALTDDGQKEYDRLNKVEAKNFDKEYLDRIAKDHKDAIDDYRKNAEKTTDVELKNWLMGKVTTLQAHHDKVVALQETIK
ncbi:DUF4142 domain-containing protein [Flavobacterium sp. NST-5]|uniref:DUF4142 domain-containing protein n=1 Tax=Flavobacterium ichthyis TaxID=2698827 RepID=A0ABW9ZBD3_9FLAO|nr:DUF4142 domain-containing protein [Flavobacterium ichthyis]NBL65842.1 DUF4142 domain-containing protein [Flavobacterium ichthyis]